MRTMIIALALLVATAANAKEIKQDFKCYVIDTDDVPHLYLMAIKPSVRLTEASKLTGKTINDGLDRPIAEIAKVEQCIPANARFASAAARMLDKNTAR